MLTNKFQNFYLICRPEIGTDSEILVYYKIYSTDRIPS